METEYQKWNHEIEWNHIIFHYLITSRKKITEHKQKTSPFVHHTTSGLFKRQLPKCDCLSNGKTHIEVKWNLTLIYTYFDHSLIKVGKTGLQCFQSNLLVNWTYLYRLVLPNIVTDVILLLEFLFNLFPLFYPVSYWTCICLRIVVRKAPG